AEKEDVIERFAAAFRGFDGDREVFDDVALADVIDEPRGPEGDVEADVVIETGARDEPRVFVGHERVSDGRLRGVRREAGPRGRLRAGGAGPRSRRDRLRRTNTRGSRERRGGPRALAMASAAPWFRPGVQ